MFCCRSLRQHQCVLRWLQDQDKVRHISIHLKKKQIWKQVSRGKTDATYTEIRQRGVALRPMPMGTPVAVTPGGRPPLGPGGTPVGKAAPTDKKNKNPVSVPDRRNMSIYRIMCLKSHRQQVVRSSTVAVPTEHVPLSAPGGPPERSGLPASAQMMPRSPGSPVPGVGRFLPDTGRLSCICLCSAF